MHNVIQNYLFGSQATYLNILFTNEKPEHLSINHSIEHFVHGVQDMSSLCIGANNIAHQEAMKCPSYYGDKSDISQ